MSLLPFSIEINNDLYEKYKNEYESGNYTSAIKTAFLYLSECIRERSNLDLDGEKLITKAFSLKNPIIKLNDLKTETDKNEQQGIMLILQGLYKAIRNPRNHNLKVDNKIECDSIIIFINYLINIIINAKAVYDYNEFKEIINDKHFDKSKQYSDEIVKIIPEEKLYDTSIKLLEDINFDNFENISNVVASVYSLLDNTQQSDFIEHVSNCLFKTTDHNVIKCIIKSFSNKWDLFKPASKLRAENILITALKDMNYNYETGENQYGNYETFMTVNEEWDLAVYLNYIIRKLIRIESDEEISDTILNKIKHADEFRKYIFTAFKKAILTASNTISEKYNSIIIEFLNNDDKITFDFIKECKHDKHKINVADEILNAFNDFNNRKKSVDKGEEDDIPF
ncbi:hypothetical protein ES705_36029 [subsurface metagenome]